MNIGCHLSIISETNQGESLFQCGDFLYTGRLEWNHLLLTGPKETKCRNSFVIFIFIANNPIFKSILSHSFLAGPITLKGCYLMMNFERKSFYWFLKDL